MVVRLKRKVLLEQENLKTPSQKDLIFETWSQSHDYSIQNYNTALYTVG
jgi:hypothetical protein